MKLAPVQFLFLDILTRNPKYPGEKHLIEVAFERSEYKDARTHSGKLVLIATAIGGPLLRDGRPSRHLARWGADFKSEAGNYSIKLTNGDVTLPSDARACGLGSYLMNEVIEWATTFGFDGAVEPIKLSETDARTVEERDSRNAFYARFGFTFAFQPPIDGIADAAGRLNPMLLSQVQTRHSRGAISVMTAAQANAVLSWRLQSVSVEKDLAQKTMQLAEKASTRMTERARLYHGLFWALAGGLILALVLLIGLLRLS